MSIMSDEVNFLVYRYLQESGYQHSAFSFGLESHIAQSNVNGSVVPPGALISIIQKGVQYIEAELCINDDGSLIDDLDCIEPIPLIDAVIPEALAVRAATILKNASQAGEAAKGAVAQDVDMETDNANVECHNLTGHVAEVFSCRWSPSSKVLASAGADGNVCLWQSGSLGKDTKPIVLEHFSGTDSEKKSGNDITALVWNNDGTLIASAADDAKIRIWNDEGRAVANMPQHKGLVFALKWNKKGNYLLSCSLDKRVIVWDTTSWEIKQSFELHRGPVVDIDWQNNSVFASCSTDKTIYVCKVGNDKPLRHWQGHTDEVNCVSWDSSGGMLASCSDDCSIKVWSSKQDLCLHTLTGHSKEVTLVEWCTANNSLASASYDATVRLWDVDQETCLFTFSRHYAPVQTIAFSADGKYLASASLDSLLNIWCAQTGKSLLSYKCSAGVFDIQWKPDGASLALCQADKVVKVIDAKKILAT